MQSEHPFDARLRHSVESGTRLPTLGSLMAATVAKTGSDHLVVNAVVCEEADPAEEIVHVSGASCLRSERVDQISVLFMEHADNQFIVSIWPTPQEAVWLVVSTVRYSSKEWSKVERLLQRAAPNLTPVYLSDDGLSNLCSMLSEHGDVRVSKIAGTLSDGSSDQRGYTDDPYLHRPTWSEALEQFEPGGSAKSMQVTVGEDLSLHIRRRAGLTYKGGDASLFADAALAYLASLAADSVNLFRGRERKPNTPMPKPLSIGVTDGEFSNPAQLRAFVTKLDGISDMGIAVLHGNPYLHVIVTDYRDGSNFDLFITDDSEIRIYPGFRTSTGSLARFSDSLGTILPATNVREAGPKTGLTRDDFLADA